MYIYNSILINYNITYCIINLWLRFVTHYDKGSIISVVHFKVHSSTSNNSASFYGGLYWIYWIRTAHSPSVTHILLISAYTMEVPAFADTYDQIRWYLWSNCCFSTLSVPLPSEGMSPSSLVQHPFLMSPLLTLSLSLAILFFFFQKGWWFFKDHSAPCIIVVCSQVDELRLKHAKHWEAVFLQWILFYFKVSISFVNWEGKCLENCI